MSDHNKSDSAHANRNGQRNHINGDYMQSSEQPTVNKSKQTIDNSINTDENYATSTSDTVAEKELRESPVPSVAELIGEFGSYQLSLTVLAFVRYVCVAMMTNSGPLIAPSIDFWCKPPSGVDIYYPANVTNRDDYFRGKCDLETLTIGSGTNGSARGHFKCQEWKFNTTQYGITITDTFELICDRDWYRSLFQSTVSVGVVIASIVFGSFSDENGRRYTLRVSILISLIAGSVSVFAPNFTTYAVSRALCTMSEMGIVGSMYTIIVETLGNKYRGLVCIIVFTGWSMGVMIMPWITDYFFNFRHVMMFTVACHLLTLPWLLTVGESIRWLLINARFHEAEQEVERICQWNSSLLFTKSRGPAEPKLQDKINNDFCRLKTRFLAINERQQARGDHKEPSNTCASKILRSLFGGFLKVGQIFKSRQLTITTATIVWTTFNSEMMYMLFIMINSDVGDNVKLNYAIGGVMEILATLIAIVMISRLKRKFSLTSTLTIISVSIFCLAFTHQSPSWSVGVLNFTKLAISTLSSLIYVIATELFPTTLRQTGMGLVATLGSLGAVLAPFIRKELTDMIGMTNVMLSMFMFPLSAAVLVPLFLRETKDEELPDDIDEIEHKKPHQNDAKEMIDMRI